LTEAAAHAPSGPDDALPVRIALTLVSHTNAGKTTLARTLLGEDIGDVRDEAHVTEVASEYLLVSTPQGDALALWDTPGFGDSTRLARRLEQSGFGWLIGQAWDRYRDRPLWSSQQALRNVREHADVVLYLVNAAEDPADAGYVAPEMRILDWIDKPVIVLLNQMGAPRTPAEEAAEIERWRLHLADARTVRKVLALDAFARCWVQEITLLEAVAETLPGERRAGYARLLAAWQRKRHATFEGAMDELARRVARAAHDREPLPPTRLIDTLRDVGIALGVTRGGQDTAKRAAMRALAVRLDQDILSGTARLIALHGLEGEATQVVLARLVEHYAVTRPVGEGKAAILGGLLTGSLAGLKADIVTGGLTVGGGLIAGGILGALGAAGLAKGYNLVRGGSPSVGWADAVLDDLAVSAILGYLAVAHYGRGRGDWAASEHPKHWEGAVRAELAARRDAMQAIWARRAGRTDPTQTADALRTLFTDTTLDVLARLYPHSIPTAS
jgi:hypothetical protein